MFSDPAPTPGPNMFSANSRRTPDIELTSGVGILNWWYRIAAPRISSDRPLLKEREMLRRGRLAATLLLAIMVLGIINIPVAASNPSPSELYGDVAGLVGCIAAVALNRIGAVSAASILLATLLELGFGGIILAAPGGLSVPNLLLMPLLVITELIAVSLLTPWSVFLVAAINCGFVVLVTLNWPADQAIEQLRAAPGTASLIISPQITLFLIVALVTFLWVRGAISALVARDRAEELANLEHAVAEQRRSLEVGMQQMLDTLVRVANGDFTARAPMDRNSALWRLGASLNTMIARQQKVSDAQYQLQRVMAEIARLIEAVRQARAGRPPIWPAETGTPLDPLIRELAGSRGPTSAAGMGPNSTPFGGAGTLAQIPAPGAIPPFSAPGWNAPFPTGAPMGPGQEPPSYPPTRGEQLFDPRYLDQGAPQQPNAPDWRADQSYPDLGGPPYPHDR